MNVILCNKLPNGEKPCSAKMHSILQFLQTKEGIILTLCSSNIFIICDSAYLIVL